MNWISVEDRLPEYNQLVMIRYLFGDTLYYGVARLFSDVYIDPYNSKTIALKGEVTHWCEITEPSEQRVLPKVPKEDRVVGK